MNFQRECLDAHNAVRAQYGCQPLIWSQELCDLAHSWAVKLAERGRILFPELQGKVLVLVIYKEFLEIQNNKLRSNYRIFIMKYLFFQKSAEK